MIPGGSDSALLYTSSDEDRHAFQTCPFYYPLRFSVCAAQVPSRPKVTLLPFTATVDQPAYTGEPIWVRTEPRANIRYPFRASIGDFGCNRLELLHDGKPVQPRPLMPWGDGSGILCGSAAPPNAPENRLPLHVWYPLQQPGIYAVRWVYEVPDFNSGKMKMDSISSTWTTFRVLQATPAEREARLNRLLASTPTDAGLLAGAYIPSLVAAAPDQRSLRAIATQLYSSNQVVAQLAASALQFFPKITVNEVIFEWPPD
jgi:hypothetical protein